MEAVEHKENEIVAIPRLLEMLELTGALVTIDAMGCQKAIAAAIRRKGADYLLPVKENQPALCHDIELFFTEQRACAFAHCQALFHQTIDNDHGRLETRRHWSIGDIDWLNQRHDWADLTSIGLIEREGERNVATTRLAGHLLRRGVDPDVALALISTWNETRNRPPLPDNELERTFDSICAAELRRRNGSHG